ncbi:putative glycosyl hydrolase [Clostridium aceticum]|uniref:Putative glycosyl hydrolase n=1 Tax=Clostridium aceticum TaxID=84022 RepID=A0A0G3W9Y5_9CLOT|nr:LysM peptidoglycan-binding domain-containing protein [Clostridium aceticum]AKL94722.1 putative glycosyl hydrolase [Clostridium aceticum]
MHQRPHVNIVIIPGDTLFFLARIFNVSIQEILIANPGIINPNILYPGQIVTIPSAAPIPPNPGFARAQYLVRLGDTLFSIARRFGLTVELLWAQNPQIFDPFLIFVNQVINLVITPPLPPPLPLNMIQIYVSVGETLISIARRTGVSLQAIIAANPQIINPNIIFVGQIINVPLR